MVKSRSLILREVITIVLLWRLLICLKLN